MAYDNGHPLAYTRANRVGEEVRLTAGVTLKAVDSLVDRNQQHFTRDQVAYLIHLAFLSGANCRTRADEAELIAMADEFPLPRLTREQRIRRRLDEMEEGARREAARPRSYPTLDVQWPDVAQPGGERPDLRVVA